MAEILCIGWNGINNKDLRYRIKTASQNDPTSEMSLCSNVDIDDTYAVSRRKGYTKILSATGVHSGWATGNYFLFVRNGDLCRFYPDSLETQILMSDVTDETMKYCEAAKRIIFTNRMIIGQIKDDVVSSFPVPTTEWKRSIPPGQAIAHYRGHLLVGRGNVLWISDVMPITQVDLRLGFKQFPHDIVSIAPVDDGIYLTTTKATYFLSGTNPTKLNLKKIANVGGIDVPVQYIESEYIKAYEDKLQITGYYPLFITEEGICLGLSSGIMVNLTQGKYLMPSGITGTSIITDDDGTLRYITTYR